MKLYKSVGDLLKDYRNWRQWKQHAMAEQLGVDVRTYRKWEGNQDSPEDVLAVATRTSVPLEVLVRLSHQYPTLYSIRTRRYALCPFDRDFVNRKVLREQLFDTEEEGDVTTLTDERDMAEILRLDEEIIPYGIKITGKTIEAATEVLPEVNILAKDPDGLIGGYVICLPLRIRKYRELRFDPLNEEKIGFKDIVQTLSNNKPICLHLYRFFATSPTNAYYLIKRLVVALLLYAPSKIPLSSVLSKYSMTKDGIELCKKLGMSRAKVDYGATKKYKTETVPKFYEARISELRWLDNYKEKV
jgi:DNA-binding XRE family transcriptional regulator